MSARAVFVLPLSGDSDTLAEAVESLLAQSDPRLRVVIADESPGEGAETARAYAALDKRVAHVSGLSPTGAAQRRRRALALAVRSAPAVPYVAWASDRDVWNPWWLAALGGVLDADASCVLAFTRSERIDLGGELVASVRHDLCDTRELGLGGRPGRGRRRPGGRRRCLWPDACRSARGSDASPVRGGAGLAHGPQPGRSWRHRAGAPDAVVSTGGGRWRRRCAPQGADQETSAVLPRRADGRRGRASECRPKTRPELPVKQNKADRVAMRHALIVRTGDRRRPECPPRTRVRGRAGVVFSASRRTAGLARSRSCIGNDKREGVETPIRDAPRERLDQTLFVLVRATLQEFLEPATSAPV